MTTHLEFFSNSVSFLALDKRPEPINYVRAILEKDETKTWLDWRKFEPTWIQLKFSAEEFDCEMLDKLCRENNNIITYDILKACVKKV